MHFNLTLLCSIYIAVSAVIAAPVAAPLAKPVPAPEPRNGVLKPIWTGIKKGAKAGWKKKGRVMDTLEGVATVKDVYDAGTSLDGDGKQEASKPPSNVDTPMPTPVANKPARPSLLPADRRKIRAHNSAIKKAFTGLNQLT